MPYYITGIGEFHYDGLPDSEGLTLAALLTYFGKNATAATVIAALKQDGMTDSTNFNKLPFQRRHPDFADLGFLEAVVMGWTEDDGSRAQLIDDLGHYLEKRTQIHWFWHANRPEYRLHCMKFVGDDNGKPFHVATVMCGFPTERNSSTRVPYNEATGTIQIADLLAE